MSAHTPGPWKVSGLDPNVIGPVRILVMGGAEVPQQQAVARVTDRTGESEANAHLIAAAPELLAELKDAVQAAGNYYALFHDEKWKERLSKWGAAIAKAEGR